MMAQESTESTMAIFEAIIHVKGTKEGKSRFVTVPYQVADRLGLNGGETVRMNITGVYRGSSKLERTKK